MQPARAQKEVSLCLDAPAFELAFRLSLRDCASLACTCSSVVSVFRWAALSPPSGATRGAGDSGEAGEDGMDLVCCIMSVAIRGGCALRSFDCPRGKTALIRAAEAGRPDVVRWLLNSSPDGAALMEQPDDCGARALHYAALEGHPHVCEVLLETGASADTRDSTGLRPLHLAAEGGGMDACKVLIEGRADVNASDVEGVTPLLVAVESGQTEVCSMLISARANPLASSIHGRTPMAVALESGKEELTSALEAALWGSRLPKRPRGALKGPEAMDLINRTIRAR
jgi:hypothetical protein